VKIVKKEEFEFNTGNNYKAVAELIKNTLAENQIDIKNIKEKIIVVESEKTILKLLDSVRNTGAGKHLLAGQIQKKMTEYFNKSIFCYYDGYKKNFIFSNKSLK